MRNDHLPGMSVRAYGRIENHFMSKSMKNFCLEARLLFFLYHYQKQCSNNICKFSAYYHF